MLELEPFDLEYIGLGPFSTSGESKILSRIGERSRDIAESNLADGFLLALVSTDGLLGEVDRSALLGSRGGLM